MSYALATLWHDRNRYMPGVLAVAFSALLIALQCGLLLGLFSITSLPIDETSAHIWVGHPEVPSVDVARPIPSSWISYLSMPEVERCEYYLQGFAYWDKPTGGSELCVLIGSSLTEDSMGTLNTLTPYQRSLLTYPGNIIIDESEFERLGISRIGQTAEISGRRVRVVDTVRGVKSLAGPYIFCHIETARPLLRLNKDQTTFILARVKNTADIPKVVAQLNQNPKKICAYSAEDFSLHSRVHWLTKTKAGIALGFAAMLGLLVGAVVTSQTLYAATAASVREFGVLRAMGIPRWRIAWTVVSQAFWVGFAGVVLAVPTVFLLAQFGNQAGAKVLLPWWLLTGAVTVTMFMALISGLAALRSLRLIEPIALLR